MVTVTDTNERLAQLRSLELFDTLGDDALAAVESAVEWIEVPAGGDVFREGDPSDAVYLVAHGRLGILKHGVLKGDDSGERRVVREIGAGQPVGELGLLLDQPRSATAIALRDSLLARLDRASFERLIERQPAALLPLSRRLAERLVVTSAQTRSQAPPAVWLVVAASPSVELSELWHDLAELLGSHGARCMTAADLGRACGGAGQIEPVRAARWLQARVRDGQPIFVLAEDESSIRMLAPSVDRTLIVADAAESVGIGPLEDHFTMLRARGVPATMDLVLLQCSDQLPHDTAAWLEHVRPARHHHLRRDDRPGLERLARKLTGRAVGLALGGGGARAFVHIGVIRALQEAGVPIDFIAGTNIGAVIGAQLALGWGPDQMLEVNGREWPWVGRDLTLPLVSLLGGRNLRALTRRMFGDTTIENLWLDFRCATIDLSWCRLVAQKSGPLEKWVRASASVPGIHPPVVHAGRLYVDGGLLQNVPAEIAREAGAGTVISVDPSPFRRQTIDDRFEEAPGGLDFVLQCLPIVGSGFPGIMALIHRALSVGQQVHRLETQALSDLYIEPPVDRFGVTDYSRCAEIAEFGYVETQRRLERDGQLVLS